MIPSYLNVRLRLEWNTNAPSAISHYLGWIWEHTISCGNVMSSPIRRERYCSTPIIHNGGYWEIDSCLLVEYTNLLWKGEIEHTHDTSKKTNRVVQARYLLTHSMMLVSQFDLARDWVRCQERFMQRWKGCRAWPDTKKGECGYGRWSKYHFQCD